MRLRVSAADERIRLTLRRSPRPAFAAGGGYDRRKAVSGSYGVLCSLAPTLGAGRNRAPTASDGLLRVRAGPLWEISSRMITCKYCAN
jgi:hypothetical protein